jgi:ribosomal protein S18 acetylase RimI-like enzyme
LKEPVACTEGERREFARFVRRGFEGSDQSLDDRIRDAKQLAFYYVARDTLAGIAGLKAPSGKFRGDLFGRACVPISPDDYPLELGWVFVDPAHRGNKVALGLCRQLLTSVTPTGVYATTRPNNVPMIGMLRALGFERVGEPYSHRSREHVVFLRPIAQLVSGL